MSQMKESTMNEIELTAVEVAETSQLAEDVYMKAITEAGRQFSQKDLDTCIGFFIEAAKNTKFLGTYGQQRCTFTHAHTRRFCGNPGCRES